MPSGKKNKRQRRNQAQLEKQPTGTGHASVSFDQQPVFWHRGTLPALALIVFIGLIIYANSFKAPFVFDDLANILETPFIRIRHISINNLLGVLNCHATFRPVPNLTFALNYFVHQYNVFGYHIVNVIIHLINAVLVFLITRQTLILYHPGKAWIAMPAALLWLANPVHTQSVTYVVQRMNSLAAMFYLLSMVCYIQARLVRVRHQETRFLFRPAVFFILSVLSGLLGMLSKEIVAMLPVMIFLYEWYFFQKLDKDWFKKQVRWIIALFVVLSAVALIYFKGQPLTRIIATYAEKDFTPAQRLLTEPGIILYYLSLLLFPDPERLRIFYLFSFSHSFLSLTATLLSITALAGLIAGIIILRKNYRLVSFALAWFLVNLLIESSIVPLAPAFEHRTYLPSVFVFIALAYLLFTKLPVRMSMPIICVAVVLCGFWTWQRNAVWKDKVRLLTDAVMKTPTDVRACNNLGQAYIEEGKHELALASFKAALENDDKYEKAYNNMGFTLLALNRPEEALPYLKRAIALKPGYFTAHFNLGIAYASLGLMEKAEASYVKTLELNPAHENAHNNLGIIKMDRGQFDEAVAHFQNAIGLDPYSEKAHINMGIACFRKGKTDRSLACFKKALEINPKAQEAARIADDINSALDRYGQALTLLQQEYNKRPDDPVPAVQLATVCQQIGMRDMAVDVYEQALTLDPECGKCLEALAAIYGTTSRYDRAAQMLERLCLLYPGSPNIPYNLATVYAQNNQKEEALAALKKAMANGFTEMDYLFNDETLKSIRDTDYFRSLATTYR